MPTLHVALEEGFNDDEVRVSVDGQQVYGKSGVTTRLQIGRADSFDVDVRQTGKPAGVELVLPQRGVREQFSVALGAQTFLGISIAPSGKVQHRIGHEPFGYA